MERFTLRSPFPPDEVARRLRQHVAPGWALCTSRPVMGHAGRRFLWLRMASNALGRNAMQPYLFARMEDDEGGTVLACRFLLHPLSLLFLTMWLAVLLVMVVTFGRAVGGAFWYLPTVVLLAGFLLLIVTGRHFARNDRAALLEFLKEQAGAEPV